MASTAIDQYCANVTDSCADFAACKNGVFDNLLVDSELAEISTKLTARELLSLEAPRHSEYFYELWGARRLVSVMYFPSGPFRVKIVPGLSLTSFSKQVCHGRFSSCVLSPPLLRCAVWASIRASDRRIRRPTLHRRRDAVMHPRSTRHLPIGGGSARRRRSHCTSGRGGCIPRIAAGHATGRRNQAEERSRPVLRNAVRLLREPVF